VVALIGAPKDFATRLAPLPEGARVASSPRASCQVLIAFFSRRLDLEGWIIGPGARRGLRSLWIAWPKKGSGVASDLRQQDVREIGLASGFVDYKISAIDGTYAGLLFARRSRP
jgi:hypothetical protein